MSNKLLMTLMGGSVPSSRVSITDTSASSDAPDPAGYRVNSSGLVQIREFGVVYTNYETWLLTGVNTDYQVRATYTGTAPTGSATSTWLTTSASQTWTLAGAGLTCVLTVSIRDATTLVVLDTAVITLSVI